MIRLFNHYLSVRLLLLTGLEAAVLFQSVILGFDLRFGHDAAPPLVEAAIFAGVMLMAMSALGLYHLQAEPFRTTVHRVLIAYGLSLLLISLIFYLVPETYIGRGVLAWSSLLALGSVLVIRVLFFRVTDFGLPKRRVLVLGNGQEAEDVIRFLHQAPNGRNSVQYAGLYPVMPERDEAGRERSFNHDALRRAVTELRVSEIVIAVRERRGGVLPLRQLLDCKLHGVKVADLQTFYEREQGVLRVDTMRASWMIFGEGFDQGMTRDVVKRLFDLGASLALIVATLPVLLFGMIAVVLDSGFPIFYTQERVGQGGRRFRIVKLRTMRQDAEADGKPRWAGVNDSRVTRVGQFLRKTRIDELPQLWNVLRGDMSFVGPRPERPFFVEQLTEKIPFYDVRHSVKPGVTGWAQVRYPYGATVEDGLAKLQYDLYYVKNHSLFLDLMVMVETVQVVLLGKGAR